MKNYCKNCGAKIEEHERFCPDCGKPVKITTVGTSSNRNKIIIVILLVIIAVLAVAVLLSFTSSPSEVPLQPVDFGGVTMLAPQGANFIIYNYIEPFQNIDGWIYYQNTGNYSEDVGMVGISTTPSIPSQVSYLKEEDGIQIFKDEELDFYFVSKVDGDYYLSIMGSDYKTMVKMLKSANITDRSMLKSDGSQPTSQTPTTSSQTTSSQQQSPSSPISIKGGSFSTGSAEEDKTYASIYVGKEHAGESVTVQIWYSRDGNTLNNGNMVPVTVHSDGYIEVTSADAYHYYPDYATINLYDSAGKLLDSRSVSLSPESGTQTF